jgi:hypothetical protein
MSDFGAKLWLLLRRFPSLRRSCTVGLWVLTGCIASHNGSVGSRWCCCGRRRGWFHCLVVWSWKGLGGRSRKLWWNSSWPVVYERALTGALLCIITVVVPVGMLAPLLAILSSMAMLATSLTESASAWCETAFRTDGVPMGSAVVSTRLNVGETGSRWW